MSGTDQQTSRSHPQETWALVLLTIGIITGPIGTCIGWGLTATSKRWSLGQKLLAAAIPVALYLLIFYGGGAAGGYGCVQVNDGPEVCEPHPPVWIAWAVLLVVVGGVVTSVGYLNRAARTLRRR